MPLELTPPIGAELVESMTGLRLRGTAQQLLEFSIDIRALAALPNGDTAFLGRWLLVVSNSQSSRERVVAMPQNAWRICASKFVEVATGREDSPFDFSSCGYLVPPPNPDFGVELTSEPPSDRHSLP